MAAQPQDPQRGRPGHRRCRCRGTTAHSTSRRGCDAHVVRDLALELLGLHEKIHELDKLIEARFREHELAPVISSMPGIGPLLGAEFLAATGGDLSRFPSADRLAAFSGVAPVPRDSCNVNGNLHPPRRYHRGLQRVFYRSAGNSA
ncbi:hypothetical protein BOG92_008690 [Streptomyces sp. WAC00263]|nr:hypothetical protein BOG92_008690 [Streptomyces sp. WAC00263]